MRRLEETAQITGHELEAVEGVPKVLGQIARDGDAGAAARTIGRYTGPAGVAVSAGGAAAGYRADRLGGTPRDEAALRNGGGFAGGLAGAAAGAVLGSRFGPAGSVVGGVFGGLGGAQAIEGLAPGYRELKARLFIPRSDYGPRVQPYNMAPAPMTPADDPRFWMTILR